jgi:hypothetical protein
MRPRHFGDSSTCIVAEKKRKNDRWGHKARQAPVSTSQVAGRSEQEVLVFLRNREMICKEDAKLQGEFILFHHEHLITVNLPLRAKTNILCGHSYLLLWSCSDDVRFSFGP